MVKLEVVAQSSGQRERKYRRFPLRYPVQFSFRLGDSLLEFSAVSRNISIGGLLLEAASPAPLHCMICFTLTLQGENMVRPIQLRGEGEVLRVQTDESGAGFAIALQCSRPLTEIADVV